MIMAYNKTINTKQSYDVYRQGAANLALEGMSLSYTQNKLALLYQAGKITKTELIQKAIEHARS
jgi:hypothetical protein